MANQEYNLNFSNSDNISNNIIFNTNSNNQNFKETSNITINNNSNNENVINNLDNINTNLNNINNNLNQQNNFNSNNNINIYQQNNNINEEDNIANKFNFNDSVPTGMDLKKFQMLNALKTNEMHDIFAIGINKLNTIYNKDNIYKPLPVPISILLRFYLKYPIFIPKIKNFASEYENIFKKYNVSEKMLPLLFGYNSYLSKSWLKDESIFQSPIMKKFFHLIKFFNDKEAIIKDFLEFANIENKTRKFNVFVTGIWDKCKYNPHYIYNLEYKDFKYVNTDNFYSYIKINNEKIKIRQIQKIINQLQPLNFNKNNN